MSGQSHSQEWFSHLINYNNHLWYVANRKSKDDRFDNRFNRDEGNEVNFMLIPLISFINMKFY